MTEKKRVTKKKDPALTDSYEKIKDTLIIPTPPVSPVVEEEEKDKGLTVESICTKNRFSLSVGSVVIGGFIADFINEDKGLIIEVEKEGRDSQERVNAFYKFRYKVLFIPRYYFKKANAEKYITGAIKGFLR